MNAQPDSHWLKPATVRRELFAGDSLLQTLGRLASESGKTDKQIIREARHYLDELLPGTSGFGKRLLIRFGRYVYTRGYDRQIDCDEAEVARLREVAKKHPITFVCNHRSQVDSFAIFCALHDNALPHPITFGGINMKIPVMGNILKGGGLVFIRRAFQDNLVYKTVLRAYIDYLVEHGLPLFWAIEGTRSRTGKMVPPRFGLMNWVLDAHERMSQRDLMIVPISVSYDQIADVNSYSEEQLGETKKPENFQWLVQYIRGFRQPFGPISVHFGEAVSVKNQVTQFNELRPDTDPQRKTAVPRIVITACNRLNDVTPVTRPSLISMILLGARPHALAEHDLADQFGQLVDFVRSNGWPTTFDVAADKKMLLNEAIESLVESGTIERHNAGFESVFSVARGKELNAAYYRNNSIHFFVPPAIAELSLANAADSQQSKQTKELVAEQVLRLRELLRYEFYFMPNGELLASVYADLDARYPGWQSIGGCSAEEVWQNISRLKPLLAHKVLPSFLEAYQIVADGLNRMSETDKFDRGQFISNCIGTGEQLYRLGRISNHESIAKAMFETGIYVARNHGLFHIDSSTEDTAGNRHALATELHVDLATLAKIRFQAAARESGLPT